MTEFRLGINTCFAVKRWPEPEAWAAVVRDRLGLDLVQHSLDLVDLTMEQDVLDQAAEVKQAVETAGLEVGSVFTGLGAYSTNLLLDPRADARMRATSWYCRVIEFAAAIGAPIAGGHVGAFSVADWADPAARERRWAGPKSSLDVLCGFARVRGLEALVLENMAVTREPATIEQITDLLTAGGRDAVPLKLCLDVGHQCVPGSAAASADPYEWLEQLGARSPIVHLQQSDVDADHHWAFTAEHNAEGRIDARKVLEALERSTADHVDLVLEVIHSFETPDDVVLAELEESVEYWRKALSA